MWDCRAPSSLGDNSSRNLSFYVLCMQWNAVIVLRDLKLQFCIRPLYLRSLALSRNATHDRERAITGLHYLRACFGVGASWMLSRVRFERQEKQYDGRFRIGSSIPLGGKKHSIKNKADKTRFWQLLHMEFMSRDAVCLRVKGAWMFSIVWRQLYTR